MVRALTLLFACQLAGEVVVRAAGLSFPGPVLGMALLVAGLAVVGRPGPALESTADGILRNLSLLFVPAAVGVIQQAGLIAENWLAIAAGVAGSTLLTLLVTVGVFRAVARLQARGRG
jgi:holin-like protein